MTEPSQYFKGRTVQEQMNEVIGYVDARSTEVATDVAAAKASEVLEPAEAAKVAAQAAQSAAETAQDAAEEAQDASEAARDTTLAALPQVQSDIDALEGRMDTVELKIQTAEGNIVTIQGQITALQTADGQNVKLTGEHAIGNYALLLTGNQIALGSKQIPEMSKLKAMHTATNDNYLSLYEIAISNNLASGVFEVYDRGNHTFGVYYVDIRNFAASCVKLYGNATADRFAIAINGDKTKMYIFVRSTRVNADVKWCGYAWQEDFIGSMISVNNNIEETVDTLVAGDTYQWVGKA